MHSAHVHDTPTHTLKGAISVKKGPDAVGMHVVFRNVSYTIVPGGKKDVIPILCGVSGAFRAGQMTAVMGPSGSGKTTLMDLLSGRKTLGVATGVVLYGGEAPSKNLLRRYCGYCEQQDTLIGTLTVEEMLMYTACLKRPASEPQSAKRAEVEKLLKQLALTGCRATRIGNPLKRGVSGGQAKRVNIGIALITDPRVLFLDEPTSGLDSFTANEVMGVVKGIALDMCVTIAATIHSPSSHAYSLFDAVMVVIGGRVAYSGHPQQACVDYFTGVLGVRPLSMGENLAEYLMNHCTLEDQQGRGRALTDAYSASDLHLIIERGLDALQTQGRRGTGWGVGAGAAGGAGLSGWAAKKTASLRQIGLRSPSAASMTRGHAGTDADADDAAHNAENGKGKAAVAAAAAPHLDLGFASNSSGCMPCSGDSSWTYVTPWYTSLGVLLRYRTLTNYRTLDYLGPRMFDKIIFAVIMMMLYFQKGDDFVSSNVPNMAALMYLCVAQPAWGAVAFIPAIISERALYVRERNDGLYRPISYIMFKAIDELSLNWVVGLASSGILFGGTALQGSYVYFWLMLMTTLSNGVLIAYAISSLCSTMDIANAVVPTLLAVMLFLSGFLIRVPDIPVYLRWLTWVNMLKYAWGGLMLNQFEEHPDADLGGNPILAYYGLDNALGKWGNLGVVTGFAVFWAVLAWAALAFVRHHQR
ncbi:hypothetical protein FOA52_000158 [Chlamydomonas sp. UWO 241]|nr:hypothetical protein FOA52_000158 [Chlamydomonas sp. UWO 241]